MSAARHGPVSLRPATDADVAFLVDLRRATMTPHEAAAGISRPEAEVRRRVLARYECARVVVCAGEPVGVLKVVRDGPDWELLQIQLLPGYQGAGIGTALVRTVIEEARAAGASLRLHVLETNPARALYERLGFAAVRERGRSVEMRLSSPTEAPCQG
jgi:ribosomal protein S18 acetylase RimI-like enzyme